MGEWVVRKVETDGSGRGSKESGDFTAEYRLVGTSGIAITVGAI